MVEGLGNNTRRQPIGFQKHPRPRFLLIIFHKNYFKIFFLNIFFAFEIMYTIIFNEVEKYWNKNYIHNIIIINKRVRLPIYVPNFGIGGFFNHEKKWVQWNKWQVSKFVHFRLSNLFCFLPLQKIPLYHGVPKIK
jgi:hypothetical protein